MAIKEKDRKVLWGKSGNRCAICRCELVMVSITKNDDSIVGDECHIIAKAPNGPRGNPAVDKSQIDSYQNLILLCRIHHKMIDDQPLVYSEKRLKQIKRKHEEWVRTTLHEGYDVSPIQHKANSHNRLILDFAELITNLTEIDRRSGKYDDQIKHALSELDTRHRVVLEYRFGLFGHRKLGYTEIGDKFGIPAYRIKTYERQALNILKNL